ncbi:Crp/Fnr family transcriptional regulator, partial [candidate division KSB1 bacterium]
EDLKPSHIKTIILLGRMRDIPAGHPVVKQGEFGKSMYLILEGEATISVKDKQETKEVVVSKLGPGEVYGELSLIDPGPRSANLKAITEVRCIEFDWEGLVRMRKYYPRISADFMINLSRILGSRLTDANKTIIAHKLNPLIQ